ncbi:TniQ family protein [Streptomyces sp. H10-C2]|uniref:TniQ family protein n=1 Tax=unclassified Streptomyces TaxID=2593676 RepID=UPI0024B9555D|nr:MULTISPECIES: TniQ family protein [unclassified Streptomyces]MDJ0347538.1 TniQ family protein [Streptomyces sp. PH10-H1]MDJ0375731.1 TniQ family protein [Streptomyces sp. H10-C2]
MPTQPDRLRRLPVTLGPVHDETLGSYLHRLAVANNRPASFLARLLGPLPPEFSPLSNTTTGWNSHSPDRLATLSGRPTPHLARALPALAELLSPHRPGQRTERMISRPCRCCIARRSPTASVVITLSPVHVHLCPRHQLWTRSTHDIPLVALPEVVEGQRRLDQLARRHRQTGRALDLARKIVEDWSASGMPIDLGTEWTDRLDRVEALAVSKKISAEDRSHLAAFPEIVVLTHLILDPPTSAPDPKALYLATTAELSRRFARIYTTLGTQDPLYRRFCLYRDRDGPVSKSGVSL